MLFEVIGIDFFFFFDEDGKVYFVNNDDVLDNKFEYSGYCIICVQEFDVNVDKMVGLCKILVNKGVCLEDKFIWIEGLYFYKINGNYFLMFVEGGIVGWYLEVIFCGDFLMGKFILWKNNFILIQCQLDVECFNLVMCVGYVDLV